MEYNLQEYQTYIAAIVPLNDTIRGYEDRIRTLQKQLNKIIELNGWSKKKFDAMQDDYKEERRR